MTLSIADAWQQWRTAIHEAGHAVAAIRLGLDCKRVTIEADHDSAGHAIVPAKYGNGPVKIETLQDMESAADDEREMLSSTAIHLFAGAEAEREFFRSVSLLGCKSDLHKARMWIKEWCVLLKDTDDESRKTCGDRLKDKAAQIIRRDRASVERLAIALVERESLTGAEIKALI